MPDGEEKLAELFTAFFGQPALTVASAKELAQRMAGMTRIIRDLIAGTFEHEKEHGWLHDWLAAFRETLIPDLDEKQFADMFAQTLAYGLFAARVHAPPGKPFSREMAAYNLPKTNPFLRKLFAEIAGVNMPDSIAWAVDDIVELLKHADMAEILADFGKGKGKEDPVVHFYETFLAAYDPKMRESPRRLLHARAGGQLHCPLHRPPAEDAIQPPEGLGGREHADPRPGHGHGHVPVLRHRPDSSEIRQASRGVGRLRRPAPA